MLAVVPSGCLQGVSALAVHVEVNAGQSGEPRLVLVGLPDAAVKESNDRVTSALTNSGFKAPQTRTTINLAPGHLRKEGPLYDLPIALGLCAATRQLRSSAHQRLPRFLIAGELSLSGETRPVKGGLALALLARDLGLEGCLLPPRTATEASLLGNFPIYAVSSLDQAIRFLDGDVDLPREQLSLDELAANHHDPHAPDFAEVKGQHALRRAVEVAVAGGHNLLVIGPPGSGKSMVAKRIPTIMPAPTQDEFLEILAIHSAAGRTIEEEAPRYQRPFRAPHHTISDAGLIGGGVIPGPGEISLAHHGVLFLDELPEFKRSVLEVLRQPLEDGEVTISRSAGKVTLPCGFMLVAAMNPCPCGYLGDPRRSCKCSPTQIERYRARISGPLLDRIDLHVEAPALPLDTLRDPQPSESSATLRARIAAARQRQETRFHAQRYSRNAAMPHGALEQHAALTPELTALLQQAMDQLALSARAYHRILKVARTIADLAAADAIAAPHLLEAIQYRTIDRAALA